MHGSVLWESVCIVHMCMYSHVHMCMCRHQGWGQASSWLALHSLLSVEPRAHHGCVQPACPGDPVSAFWGHHDYCPAWPLCGTGNLNPALLALMASISYPMVSTGYLRVSTRYLRVSTLYLRVSTGYQTISQALFLFFNLGGKDVGMSNLSLVQVGRSNCFPKVMGATLNASSTG